MLCECESLACRTLVLIGLDEYDELRRDRPRFLTALGHESGDAELETETSDYAIRRTDATRDPRMTREARARVVYARLPSGGLARRGWRRSRPRSSSMCRPRVAEVGANVRRGPLTE